MHIFESLNALTNAVDTLFRISTFEWTKKNLTILAITTTALIGGTVLVSSLNKNEKEDDENKEENS